ncbi:MAG: hypothetical protein A4S09_02960 [Proteobacteria bacterium SG_bin7]|nr:MAG: hypothetical protein A4S09_02960 [Proteobacteria bacterium SG_bin7]
MYLIVNAVVVILLVMSILFLRKGATPQTKLNLRQGGDRTPFDPKKPQFAEFDGEARSLNVVFQHNGEWFDAYEVLELPAGAGSSIVKTQFENLLKNANKDKSKLLRLAYEALVQQGRI